MGLLWDEMEFIRVSEKIEHKKIQLISKLDAFKIR